MEEMTQEEIQKCINAAFDSVNLINQIISAPGDRTQEEIDTVNRNEAHLRIMMGKEWFTNALSVEQEDAINNLI